MKTKTLVLTALLALGGGAAAMAQSVYSLNIVGYVNSAVPSGFSLIANPLVTGTNGLGQVIPSAPDGTVVYKLKADGSFSQDMYINNPGIPVTPGWYDANTAESSTNTLSPGEGFFVYSTAATNLTFVGEVKTGSSSVALNNGFSLVASVVPQTYSLVAPEFPAQNGMVHYQYNVGTGAFLESTYIDDAGIPVPAGWYDSEANPTNPQAAPAVGFFLYNPNTSTNWTRSFTL